MPYLQKIKPFSLVITIVLACLAVQLFAPESLELLRYQSKEVDSGEWWRIITANFCHSNWNHFGLNMVGVLLIDYLFQPIVSIKTRSALLAFCILVNTILLHSFLNLHWYVGMSGALHGFLIGNALFSLKKARWLGVATILVVSAKLITELNWEINSATAGFIDANVVEEAHLFGAISAVIFYLFYLIWLFGYKKGR